MLAVNNVVKVLLCKNPDVVDKEDIDMNCVLANAAFLVGGMAAGAMVRPFIRKKEVANVR